MRPAQINPERIVKSRFQAFFAGHPGTWVLEMIRFIAFLGMTMPVSLQGRLI